MERYAYDKGHEEEVANAAGERPPGKRGRPPKAGWGNNSSSNSNSNSNSKGHEYGREHEQMDDEAACRYCGKGPDENNVIILCDNCDEEYHQLCMDPPLVTIPEGEWYCQKWKCQKEFRQIVKDRNKSVKGEVGKPLVDGGRGGQLIEI